MDIIDLLERGHAEVNQLFGRFRRSSRRETRSELATTIIHELSVHAAVEEQFVYPVVRAKVDGGSALVDHGIHEHHEVKQLLSKLQKVDPWRAEASTIMNRVAAAVREHVADEEGEVLPALRASSNAQFRRKLGSVVERAKSVVPTRPHPLVPGTATAQLIAGPWASFLDRMRDLVA